MSAEAQSPPPRLLLFSHETTLSGAPMQLLHLARELTAAGWNVTFAAPEAGPISELLVAEKTPVVFDPTFLTDLSHTALRELCPRFDVVVANTITSWPVVHAAHIERVPVIWYIHETRVGVHLIGEIAQIRPSLREADLIVTPTSETARIYEALTSAPIEVVPYGIPDLGLSPPSPSDVVRFVLLGSYEPRKGQDVMMQAIERLDANTLRRCRFTFAGRPLVRDIFERVQRGAAQFPNVEIRDGVDHATAQRLIAEHDVLVCSSRDETMPIAIIEAMSLGRAVISTDVGGIREWLKEELNGWLVPAENPDALAAAIGRAVADDRSRRDFANAGRRTYERHFRLRDFTQRFADLIRATAVTKPPAVLDRDAVYQKWVREFDTFSEAKGAALRRRLRTLRRQPVISILMPVFNPELRFLRAAIESVKAQVYERWELCIADDASTDPGVRAVLEGAAAQDARVKLTFRTTNGHISAASNSALTLATGEWCALLDHDDELAPAALAFVALKIAEYPSCALIYSDEDKLDDSGVRSNPFFKTDWNPELFLAQNYINHLGVYRTDLLREIGGFREGFEGSQDYDLALRCIERLTPEQIRHIPRVLYHWRTAAGSLAGVVDAKPYAREAARRAIADHLQRSAIDGSVVPCPENAESHRVIYGLPRQQPLVTAVILTRDRAALLEQCVRSLREVTDYAALEILVVDNGSVEPATHALFAKLKEDNRARVLRDDGVFNFSRLNNLAAGETRGELLLFLNNDIEATEPGWLAEMVSHALRPNVGAVGARLWFPNETLQHGGVVLGLGGAAGHAHVRIPRGHPGYFNRAVLQGNYSAVTAACMLVPRHAFESVGGFNERDLAVNFNDVDFCLRLRRKGFDIVWTPYANLIHHESASRGHHRTGAEQAQFAREITYAQREWGAELMNDPLYSPNLTLSLPGFEIAFPPRIDDPAKPTSLQC